MTDSERSKIESLAELLGDSRRAAGKDPVALEGEGEADRLEGLLAFYKASLTDV